MSEEEFSPEEIHDLRKILDQMEEVAMDDDSIAAELEYNGRTVVLTTPAYINLTVREMFDEVSDDER